MAEYLFCTVSVLLISVLIAYICLDVFVKRRFLLKYAKKTPVLPYLPIVGSAHLLLGQEILPVVVGLWRKIEEPFFFWMFNVPYYFTNEPSQIREVLTNPNTLERAYVYDFVKPVVLDSLLTAKVGVWKKKRRFLSRRFTQKALENFVPVFNKTIDKLVATINDEYDGNCLGTLERFVADTFMESLCNIKLDDEALDTTLYREFDICNGLKQLTGSIIKRYMKPWLYPDIVFFNTAEGREFQRTHQHLNEFYGGIIEERRKFFDTNKEEGSEKSIIDIMMKENMSNDDIVGEVKQFGGAAAETSGLTLALALNLLAMNPDIQDKVLREVLDVVGPDRPVEYKDTLDLKFTEMVLQETLRLFPPGPFLGRTVLADTMIGGILLPKGTNVAVNILDVHRSEKYWKDPLKFDPDRFLPDEVEKRPPGTFLPFSLGPRNCIGGKYAMILMKMTLARIIRNYKVTTKVQSVLDFRLEVSVLLVVNGIDCTFIRRDDC